MFDLPLELIEWLVPGYGVSEVWSCVAALHDWQPRFQVESVAPYHAQQHQQGCCRSLQHERHGPQTRRCRLPLNESVWRLVRTSGRKSVSRTSVAFERPCAGRSSVRRVAVCPSKVHKRAVAEQRVRAVVRRSGFCRAIVEQLTAALHSHSRRRYRSTADPKCVDERGREREREWQREWERYEQ